MNKLIFLVMLLISGNLLAQESDILKNYRWKNRILIIFSPSNNADIYINQISALNEAKKGVKDREIVILSIFEKKGLSSDNQYFNSEVCEKLRKEFGIKSEAFSTLLIGKDGGEKYRKNAIFTVTELFTLIDAMPMRKAELKEKN